MIWSQWMALSTSGHTCFETGPYYLLDAFAFTLPKEWSPMWSRPPQNVVRMIRSSAVLVLQLWIWSWWQPPWIHQSYNSLYGPYLVMYKQWHWGREGTSGCTWAPLCDDVSGHSEDSWHVSVITSLSLLSLSHYMLLLRQGLQSKGLFFFLRKVWTESD